MFRMKKLETYYKEQLKNKNIKNVSIFIYSILNADITKGKYARFLIEAFLNDKFLEEDLVGGLDSIVGQAISLFHKHKSKLPENMRSVFKYSSPGDLWEAVKQFQGELSGKELKREEQEKIYRETEFIYKDEETGFQIVSPLTKASAKWWGKGTRWCTSAEKNNQFKYYFEQAPLFILLMPSSDGTSGNGNKLQLWNNKNGIVFISNPFMDENDNIIQFMDEADNTVTLKYIEQNWKLLEPICLWLNNMKYIPNEFKTPELCKLSVQNNGYDLKYIPEHLRTKELCELAVQKNGNSLKWVPEKLKTKKICELAVKNNGYALRFALIELLTEELCELAVQQNGCVLEFIPEYLRVKKVCEIAVKQNGDALEYVPEHLKTPELCKIAVQQDEWILNIIPVEYKTQELCSLAVQNNGYALQYVPDELITKELLKLAVQSNGCALKWVPKELRTKELCELAVQQSGMALKYVLEHLITEKLCELAIQNSGYALQYVPEHLKTKEICKLAVQSDGKALWYVPENYKTKEFYEIAVKQNESSLQYVPEKFKDELEQYCVKDEILEISMEKYQEIFQEIKTLFPEKHVS